MKINQIVLSLILIGMISSLFSVNELQVIEVNSSASESSNILYSSSTLTELSYFTWGGIDSESSGGIALDSMNNSYIVGYTGSFGAGGADFCLVKFNSSGFEWYRTYGGPNSDYGSDIAIDPYDNIYITGYTNSYGEGDFDFWLLKLDISGNVEWNYTWGGIEADRAFGIALDNQSNVYVVGDTLSFGTGSPDLCLVKFNSSGVAYNFTCGGTDVEIGYGLTLDSQGNIYTVGSTKSFGVGDYDIFLVKFNSTGMVWNRTWGHIYKDQGTDVKINQVGDILVTGSFHIPIEYSVEHDIVLVKFNFQGEYQWNSTWDGGILDYCFGMELDLSENVYIAGYGSLHLDIDYDIFALRFNSSGIVDWSCKWGGSGTELAEGIALGPNGTILVCGYTDSYGNGSKDICLVKFIPDSCPVSQSIDGIILGYDLLLMCGITLMSTIIIVKKITIKSKQG